MTSIRSVVFDLGGVLIDWDPRHLYRRIFRGDEAAMERFLAEVCTPEWNEEQDAGRSFAEGVALLQARHPEHRDRIAAFHLRWDEMLAGVIPGAAEILRDVKAAGNPVYALSNWSAETWPIAERRFEFLSCGHWRYERPGTLAGCTTASSESTAGAAGRRHSSSRRFVSPHRPFWKRSHHRVCSAARA